MILSKMTWESFKSQFMPLQGPCFSVIVVACLSTSKYHKILLIHSRKDETPGIVFLSRLDFLSDQTYDAVLIRLSSMTAMYVPTVIG